MNESTKLAIVAKDTKKPFPFDEEKVAKIKKTDEGYSILVHGGVNHFDDRACVALFRLIMAGESTTYVRKTIQPIDNDLPAWEQPISISEDKYDLATYEKKEETHEGRVSIIADIGRKYDPENGYFDHHQELDDGHKNFAAFGLLWEYYTTPQMREYYKEFDAFVRSMDEHDMGVKKNPVCDLFRNFNKFSDPVYEDSDDTLFNESVSILTMLFRRMLVNCHISRKAEIEAGLEGEVKVVKNKIGNDMKVAILRKFFPGAEAYARKKGCLLVAWKLADNDDRNPGCYHVQTVRPDPASYATPVIFPEEWSDMDKKPEYVKFCHKTGFLAIVDTYENVLECLNHMVICEKPDKVYNLRIVVPDETSLETIYDKYMSEFCGMGDYSDGYIKIEQYPNPDDMGIYEDTREVSIDFNMKESYSANQGISMLNRIFADITEDLYDYHDEILEKPAGNFPGMSF